MLHIRSRPLAALIAAAITLALLGCDDSGSQQPSTDTIAEDTAADGDMTEPADTGALDTTSADIADLVDLSDTTLPPPPAGAPLTATAGGGVARSSNHVLLLSVGAGQPYNSASNARHRLVLTALPQ